MAPVTDTPPQPLAVRFAQIVAFLLQGIGECGFRRQIAGPLTFRLQRRFNKMVRRFAALVAHLAKFGVDAPVRAWHRKQPLPAAAAQEPPQVPAPDPAQIAPRDPYRARTRSRNGSGPAPAPQRRRCRRPCACPAAPNG